MKNQVGENIREVRLARKLSQETLAAKCGFSNTTLSAYENARKVPNIDTLAVIAKQLGVSIDRLYYGDENIAFISSEPDPGKRIVNSFCYLWLEATISQYETFTDDGEFLYRRLNGLYLKITSHEAAVKRLLDALNTFAANKATFSDPQTYLDLIKSSVAEEIDKEIGYERK